MQRFPVDRVSSESLPRRGAFPRWVLVPLLAAGIMVVIAVISGGQTPVVLQTLTNGIWALLVLVPAAMFGLGITWPIRNSASIGNSGWPDAYRLVLAIALGLGFLSLATLALGVVHLLSGPAVFILLGTMMVAGYPATHLWWRNLDQKIWFAPLRREHWLLLAACIPVACLLTAATFPPGTLWHTEGFGYDVMEYHLQLPRQFLAANSTSPVPDNIYSFLPLNIEMLYLLIGMLSHSLAHGIAMYGLVYGSQLLHAMIMVLAAVAVALAPWPLSTRGRLIALLLVLATPWTIVIGSLAYNDGGVLLYGALALGLTAPMSMPAASSSRGWAEILILGALVGLAVGCKMTAGVMIAVPVAVIILLRAKPPRLSRRLVQVVAVTLIALAIYSPWMLRSMAATHTKTSIGNPIFPLFAGTLGMDHWNKTLAGRFDRGHRPPAQLAGVAGHMRALANQSLLDRQWSPGLATYIDALASPPGFPRSKLSWPWRLGLLWLVMLPALVLAVLSGGAAPAKTPSFLEAQTSTVIAPREDFIQRRDHCCPAGNYPRHSRGLYAWLRLRRAKSCPAPVASAGGTRLLLACMAVQLVAWLICTQLQARFLLPAVITLAWLLGIAGGLQRGFGRIIITILVVQALFCAFLLRPETGLFMGPLDSEAGMPIGTIPRWPQDWLLKNGPVERFPAHSTYYLEGLSTPLYITGHVLYSTVFDRNRLGRVLRQKGAVAAVSWLHKRGVNFLILDWPEVNRLRATYGFDSAITPAKIALMQAAGLRPLRAATVPGIQIFRVP